MKHEQQVNVAQYIGGKRVVTCIQVEVELDVAAAAKELAQKAYDNKSGISRECGGALKVTYTKTISQHVPVV